MNLPDWLPLLIDCFVLLLSGIFTLWYARKTGKKKIVLFLINEIRENITRLQNSSITESSEMELIVDLVTTSCENIVEQTKVAPSEQCLTALASNSQKCDKKAQTELIKELQQYIHDVIKHVERGL